MKDSGMIPQSSSLHDAKPQAYHPLVEKYSRQARTYDRRWNRSVGDATLQAALEAIPWDSVHRILDVGCGTGLLEESVANNGYHPVTMLGVDLSMDMLRLAQEKLSQASRVGWINALAESMPFATGSFDAVICNNSFHYYRNPVRVLEEFRRVIAADGCLVLSDWCNDFPGCKFSQWVLQLVHRTGIHRYALAHCYGLEECKELLRQAGFRVETARTVGMNLGWGIMVLRARPQ